MSKRVHYALIVALALLVGATLVVLASAGPAAIGYNASIEGNAPTIVAY